MNKASTEIQRVKQNPMEIAGEVLGVSDVFVTDSDEHGLKLTSNNSEYSYTASRKMELTSFFKTLSLYQTTTCHVPEYRNLKSEDLYKRMFLNKEFTICRQRKRCSHHIYDIGSLPLISELVT
jgi:hypothetical protein